MSASSWLLTSGWKVSQLESVFNLQFFSHDKTSFVVLKVLKTASFFSCRVSKISSIIFVLFSQFAKNLENSQGILDLVD